MNTHEWMYDGSERRCRALLDISDLPRIGQVLEEAHRRKVFAPVLRKLWRGERLTAAERRLMNWSAED